MDPIYDFARGLAIGMVEAGVVAASDLDKATAVLVTDLHAVTDTTLRDRFVAARAAAIARVSGEEPDDDDTPSTEPMKPARGG